MKILQHFFYLLFLFPINSIAKSHDSGVGYVAQSLIEPVSVVSEFVATGSIVIGMSFILASFLRYLQYRVNPLASPISTVIILLIMGIVLLCLPLAYKLTGEGIPYSYSSL